MLLRENDETFKKGLEEVPCEIPDLGKKGAMEGTEQRSWFRCRREREEGARADFNLCAAIGERGTSIAIPVVQTGKKTRAR